MARDPNKPQVWTPLLAAEKRAIAALARQNGLSEGGLCALWVRRRLYDALNGEVSPADLIKMDQLVVLSARMPAELVSQALGTTSNSAATVTDVQVTDG